MSIKTINFTGKIFCVPDVLGKLPQELKDLGVEEREYVKSEEITHNNWNGEPIEEGTIVYCRVGYEYSVFPSKTALMVYNGRMIALQSFREEEERLERKEEDNDIGDLDPRHFSSHASAAQEPQESIELRKAKRIINMLVNNFIHS